jgi:4-coumarate--CoA ligase
MFKFATKPFFRKAYGLTEHSCITLTHGDPSKGHGIAKKNSVGFLLPNLEIKFINPENGQSLPENTPGEICVRSQCVMQGTKILYIYRKREDTRQKLELK